MATTCTSTTVASGASKSAFKKDAPTFMVGGFYPAVVDRGGDEEHGHLVKFITRQSENLRPQVEFEGRNYFADIAKCDDGVYRFHIAA